MKETTRIAAKANEPLWLRFKNNQYGASDILNHFGIISPPIPIRTIIKKMDIQLFGVVHPGWSGAVKSNNTSAVIWFNFAESERRQRFTIAHELGHLMCDPLGEEFRDINPVGYKSPKREVTANRFAADLLIPVDLVHQYYTLFDGHPRILADTFGVSEQAMEIRLGSLGY